MYLLYIIRERLKPQLELMVNKDLNKISGASIPID